MAISEVSAKSRYEQFREIMDAAAGKSTADYGGQGRFWNLKLPDLLKASLHGIPLIAPEQERKASCCHSGPGESRSARSGLIRGLRGEAPFDGLSFPRLPWGCEAVKEECIQLIAAWIDDGCPPTDGLVSLTVADPPDKPVMITIQRSAPPASPARTGDAFVFSETGVNEYLYQQGEHKQRMNVDCMSEIQLDKLRFAMRELYELDKWPEDSRNYNNLALIHQNHCQHGWERFLPWHRIYLYEFEQALQDHCPDVTVPYWDWTMPQYCPETPASGVRIPPSFMAFLRPASLKYLAANGFTQAEIDKLAAIVGIHYYSQQKFFQAAGEEFNSGDKRKRLIDALLAANALWYPLRYPGEYQDSSGKPTTINKAIHYHYPTANDIEQILSLRTFRDFGGGSLYDDAFGFIDQNPHNTLHIWTGGQNPDKSSAPLPEDRNKGVQVAGRRFHSRDDLYSQPPLGDMFSNLTASYDPVFWPVHSNVDRLWWEWQQLHPNSNPVELDAVLTPWSYTIRETLDMQRFGYEYVKCTYIVPVGASEPVGRFVSRGLEIPEPVRRGFGRAEVRLHRVPQLPRSCFIRVFLNLPDADAATPLEHPNYAGYLAIFGHGSCYGGPGHCDPPPPRARKYDLRPRSHNTPRNHRINVTSCAQRLIHDGATSFQISLVVIGVDYQEENELVRLEGVSLNFLD
jgi:tyrosinase